MLNKEKGKKIDHWPFGIYHSGFSVIRKSSNFEHAFSVIEILLAAALFLIFASGAVGIVIHGHRMNLLGEQQAVATQFANEGIEAIRSIKNQNFATLSNTYCATGSGIARPSSVWTLKATGTSDTFDSLYNRVITICDVERDASGNIVASGGTIDPLTKKVTSTTTWTAGTNRNDSVALTTYITNYEAPLIISRGGLLVYGDGGTTTDAMKYRIFDGSTGTWGSVTSFPDFDTSATNKALRATRVYASASRNEKVVLTRHFNGTQESIYVHVYNGTTWSSVQMASWTGSSFDTANQGIRNFDGQYLGNGNFLLVYSDNTTTPKYRIWNGSTWTPNPPTAGSPVTNIGGIPVNVTLRNRDSSNEAMLVVFDQSSDTNTVYFNGSVWSSAIEHATNAPTNRKEFAEFAWNAENPTQGALIFQTASNDRAMNLKIWNANGSGSGSWVGNNINTSNQGATLGAMELDGGRRGAEEYLACNKDANNDIYCFRADNNVTWASPTNNILTTTTDTGIQRSFDLAYDGLTGTDGIVVYSDTTAVPKLRKYDAATNMFDAAPTNLNSLGGALRTVKLRSLPDNDDIMIMLGNANNDLFSLVWDGTNNVTYTTPSGKAFTSHGTNGSNSLELWYGFAWDKF